MMQSTKRLLTPYTILLGLLAALLLANNFADDCREPEAVGAYQPFYQAPVYAYRAADVAFPTDNRPTSFVAEAAQKPLTAIDIYTSAVDRVVPSDNATLDQQHFYYTEFMAILSLAGWDDFGQEIKDQAWYVASCESGKRLRGECLGPRYWAEGDGGASVGEFQIQCSTWCSYLGITEAQLREPATNAWAARKIFEYDRARGHEDWHQWSVKPW